MSTRPVVVGVVVALVTLVGCSATPDTTPATHPSRKSTSPSPPTHAHSKSASLPFNDIKPYTILDTCGTTPMRRPSGFALACGDAGLYVDAIHYDRYTDKVATGSALMLVVPRPGDDPAEIGQTRFPVNFRANRARVWRGQSMFTRLHWDYLNGHPWGMGTLSVIPMYGRYEHSQIMRNVNRYLAAGGQLCREKQLKVQASRGGGAGGWNIGSFIVRNVGQRTCGLPGPTIFRGRDADGDTITSVTMCQRFSTGHQRCAGPEILFVDDRYNGHHVPTSTEVRMYGYSRGGRRETTCPKARQVRPATFHMTFGDLTLVADNPGGERAMWGCDDVTIAGERR